MTRRSRLALVALSTAVAVALGAARTTAVAATAALPEGACAYVTTISSPDGLAPGELAGVAVPGSDAYAYGVFQDDMRAATAAAGRTVERTVRCGRRSIEVDLYQYHLPISPPKLVTAVYDRFAVAEDGRVRTFRVNGTSIAGRAIVGAQPPALALGTTVTLASAYRVPRTGGESFRTSRSLLVAVTATAATDGARDLATGATVYRTDADEYLAMNTIGQGSPLSPGTSSTWVMEFRAPRFGGTLTIPVVQGPAMQAGLDTPLETPLEPARLLVAPAAGTTGGSR
jgi:hypothetical protein